MTWPWVEEAIFTPPPCTLGGRCDGEEKGRGCDCEVRGEDREGEKSSREGERRWAWVLVGLIGPGPLWILEYCISKLLGLASLADQHVMLVLLALFRSHPKIFYHV